MKTTIFLGSEKNVAHKVDAIYFLKGTTILPVLQAGILLAGAFSKYTNNNNLIEVHADDLTAFNVFLTNLVTYLNGQP